MSQEILHVVDVPASPGDVYEAIEGPEGLSRWWATEVAETDGVITFSFQPGFNPQMRVDERTAERGRVDVRGRCGAVGRRLDPVRHPRA